MELLLISVAVHPLPPHTTLIKTTHRFYQDAMAFFSPLPARRGGLRPAQAVPGHTHVYNLCLQGVPLERPIALAAFGLHTTPLASIYDVSGLEFGIGRPRHHGLPHPQIGHNLLAASQNRGKLEGTLEVLHGLRVVAALTQLVSVYRHTLNSLV
jgi:hypothetical protein